jgi:hypothetical protein
MAQKISESIAYKHDTAAHRIQQVAHHVDVLYKIWNVLASLAVSFTPRTRLLSSRDCGFNTVSSTSTLASTDILQPPKLLGM